MRLMHGIRLVRDVIALLAGCAASLRCLLPAPAQDAYPAQAGARRRRARAGRRHRHPGAALRAEALPRASAAPSSSRTAPARAARSPTRSVAKSPPDGYTLLGVTSGFTITPAVYSKLPYDPLKDFAPISLVVQAPFLLRRASLAAGEIGEGSARAGQGEARRARLRLGGPRHLHPHGVRAVPGALAGVKITHIPYKGTGPALVDAMAGQVHMLFGNVLSTLTYVKAGRLRALAVTTARRAPGCCPSCRPIAESGRAGLREQHLARLARAGRHAARDRRPPERGARQGRARRPTCWRSWRRTAGRAWAARPTSSRGSSRPKRCGGARSSRKPALRSSNEQTAPHRALAGPSWRGIGVRPLVPVGQFAEGSARPA